MTQLFISYKKSRLSQYYCPHFFLFCSVHYCALHSFPTRRSSDLSPSVAAWRRRVGRCPSQVIVTDWSRERRDRKSTRLNSSHVAISYAVFCLKKKIKNSKGRCEKKRNKGGRNISTQIIKKI